MDDATPPTEPQGGLVPPAKPPTTALATASPAPEPQRHSRHPRSFGDPNTIRRAIAKTLDAVDELADTVAESLGLHRR